MTAGRDASGCSNSTLTYTLTGGEADSITDYSALRLLFTASVVEPGINGDLTIFWAELEVPDAPGATRRRAMVVP